jgi:hypothetical protein
MMLNDISLHRITDVKINIPNYDHNWVELVITNSKAETFELTMFLRERNEENIDMYQFLSGLRDSVEQAIRDTLDVKNKSDD